MTLDKVAPGTVVVIDPLIGRGRSQRLYDLGLIPGAQVEVVASHPFHGPIMVKAQNALIAIGRGLARTISCRETKRDMRVRR